MVSWYFTSPGIYRLVKSFIYSISLLLSFFLIHFHWGGKFSEFLPLNSLLPPLSSVQLLSHVRLFGTPWTAACQAFLSITNSQSLLKLMSVKLVMQSNHLILCHPLFLLPSIFPPVHCQHIIILATMSTGEIDGLQSLCERFPTKSFNICLCPPL